MSKRRPAPVPEVKEPGKLSEDAVSYVIPSKSKFYGPTVIEAVKPRKRDFLRVLFGRFVPTVFVSRRMTMAGFNRTLKHVWWGPSLQKKLYSEWRLLDRLRETESEEAA